MTTRDCFQLAERIEILARDLYAELALHPQWTEERLPLIAGELQAVAREQEVLLRRARTERLPSDLPALFDELVSMEVRFSFLHAEELTRAAEPEVGRFFATLARQDAWHRQLLQKMRPAAGASAVQAEGSA